MAYRLPNDIHKLIVDSGLVPPECREVALVLPASGAVCLRYELFATVEQIEKIAGILTAFIEKEKATA
jgi:hypothetical protein